MDSHHCEQQLDFIAVNFTALIDINLNYQRQQILIAPKQCHYERAKFLQTQLSIAMYFATQASWCRHRPDFISNW
jgi:hypothetical protein